MPLNSKMKKTDFYTVNSLIERMNNDLCCSEYGYNDQDYQDTHLGSLLDFDLRFPESQSEFSLFAYACSRLSENMEGFSNTNTNIGVNQSDNISPSNFSALIQLSGLIVFNIITSDKENISEPQMYEGPIF